MHYGILGRVNVRLKDSNTGAYTGKWGTQWSLLARFTVPITIRSNEPITMSDTLSLKRYVRGRGAQRWEIETNVEPLSATANELFALLTSKGYSEPIQIVVPQNIDFTRFNNHAPYTTSTQYFRCIKAAKGISPHLAVGNWGVITTASRLYFKAKNLIENSVNTPDADAENWTQIESKATITFKLFKDSNHISLSSPESDLYWRPVNSRRHYFRCIKKTGTTRNAYPDRDKNYWQEVESSNNINAVVWKGKTNFEVNDIVYHDAPNWVASTEENANTHYVPGQYVYYTIPEWSANKSYESSNIVYYDIPNWNSTVNYRTGAIVRVSGIPGSMLPLDLSVRSVHVNDANAKAGATSFKVQDDKNNNTYNRILPVGLMVQFSNHPKIYMIKRVDIDSSGQQTISVYPPLREAVNGYTMMFGDFQEIAKNPSTTRTSSKYTALIENDPFWQKLGNAVVMPAYLDTDSIRGMTYQDGILMDLGTLKFVEALS